MAVKDQRFFYRDMELNGKVCEVTVPGPILEVMSSSEVEAYEALPETIEYRKQQKRSQSNMRPHCIGCGRFMKKRTLRIELKDMVIGDCVKCGTAMEAVWERP